MNVKLSSIAIALIATSASAFSSEQALTRAEVRAELDRAWVQGGTAIQSSEFVEHASVGGGKSRAEVRAEVEQAYAYGQVGNQSEFVEHTNVAVTKSREDAIRAAEIARKGNSSGS